LVGGFCRHWRRTTPTRANVRRNQQLRPRERFSPGIVLDRGVHNSGADDVRYFIGCFMVIFYKEMAHIVVFVVI
jgi:hypothetical protein